MLHVVCSFTIQVIKLRHVVFVSVHVLVSSAVRSCHEFHHASLCFTVLQHFYPVHRSPSEAESHGIRAILLEFIGGTQSFDFVPIKVELPQILQSCHHVLADDRGRIKTGCKVLPKEIGRPERVEPSDPEKAYGIEWLKKLGATVFEGSIDPADVENWLNMLEKCFDVMNCPEEQKLCVVMHVLYTFRDIFKDKYYLSTYCEAKRDEFLGLKQGSLSVTEYDKKYTELSRYADVIVASEMETALRVEQNITEEKSTMELSRGTSTASGFRSFEQWSLVLRDHRSHVFENVPV
ncbi:uncharacterized protein E5676_scaffold1163G00530 [Cucumis melo var. makuwa]|uniref:Retrotransposon gag domain-containing protein n=1 Tax=Cucumis melo var. makuwa TaxID=1194695 RepID=A0A5D3DHG5_CUCMM|nr:uncharacterized protein E6C27_scaffold43052G00770 [Cucumis melo var. makuwa]TYK22729.1 uncharacterized protein E5676_scaffold1163G00530 [Cucumis melo var. makuwa]